jgi:hypothetical protein
LNTVGGVGTLAVGVLGAALLGNIQDREAARDLQADDPALYAEIVGPAKHSVFGDYRPLDQKKVEALDESRRGVIEAIQGVAKKDALRIVALFPCLMFACYLGLIVYFRSKGGYRPRILIDAREEGLMMTGGAVGPAEP